jgi:hypothetical protein
LRGDDAHAGAPGDRLNAPVCRVLIGHHDLADDSAGRERVHATAEELAAVPMGNHRRYGQDAQFTVRLAGLKAEVAKSGG